MTAGAASTTREQRFGELLFRRATGEAEEMHSARSLCRVLASIYVPGDRLLDVGCGAGHYLRSLRARLHDAIDYTGVDLSPHYIALARQAFPELTRDRFRTADARALPWPDCAFDVVVCCNVLPNIPPPPTPALRELVRVARRAVVVRTLFGSVNYIIREIADSDDPDAFGAGEGGVHNNIYTEAAYRRMLDGVARDVTIEIHPDRDFAPFDGRSDMGGVGTRVVGDTQVSGQLVLDWRFIVLQRKSIVAPDAGAPR